MRLIYLFGPYVRHRILHRFLNQESPCTAGYLQWISNCRWWSRAVRAHNSVKVILAPVVPKDSSTRDSTLDNLHVYTFQKRRSSYIFLGNIHMWNLVQVKAWLSERMGSWTDALRHRTVARLVLLVAYQLPTLPSYLRYYRYA